MSIYRTVSRLAVVTALNNSMQAPWPTLAGPNIFDSKIEPVEDMATDRIFPTCVVYTDYDKDHWTKGSKVHKDRLMTVTLELLMVQAIKPDEAQEVYQLDCPMTDSEIETSLDVFEAQVYRALGSVSVAADAFNYICPSYDNVISRRGASVEGGQRLAARQITMEMKALREPMKGVVPTEIAAFLDHLENNDVGYTDYQDRAADIRAVLTEPATLSDGDQRLRLFGYSQAVATRIGNPTGPAVLLPANLTYNFQGLNP